MKAAIVVLSDPKSGSDEALGRVFNALASGLVSHRGSSADSPALIRRCNWLISGNMATNALRTAWSEGASRSRPHASKIYSIRAAAKKRMLINTDARHFGPWSRICKCSSTNVAA